jgi:hypothetical protein
MPNTAPGLSPPDDFGADAPADRAIAVRLAINTLLGTPAPEDRDDPEMVKVRAAKLERVAVAAGEAMIEFLTRLRDERARDVHLTATGCVTLLVDALFALHHRLARFSIEAPQRRDGLDVVRQAIEQAQGLGVADLVMSSLAVVRAEIAKDMRVAGERVLKDAMPTAGLEGS